MTKDIPLEKATGLYLSRLTQPAVSRYQLGVITWNLYVGGEYGGEQIVRRRKKPSLQILKKNTLKLQQSAIITANKSFPAESVFNILGKGEHATPGEIACSVDPFSYVSHLSAMEYHGLTDRFAKMLFLSSPNVNEWKKFAEEKMRRDLSGYFDEYLDNKFPRLQRIRMSKIGQTTVHRYASIHCGAFKNIHNSILRVSTIGRTFLDMIRNPDICGGIYHVLNVYKEFSLTYLQLIIDEISQNGKSIDKARVGYILEDLCGINNSRIDAWVKDVQRGGSRKLNPSQEYSSNYSERWGISINID